MVPRHQERMANLNYIYNPKDVDASLMLRMRRTPFYILVRTFRERGLLQDRIHT
jgi:hypothetical protein